MAMTKKSLDTSARIYHVFACEDGHMHPGTEIAKHGSYACPTEGCGKPVQDVTNTPEGKQYFAFVRQDLGKQS
jgi:hypothetical protein